MGIGQVLSLALTGKLLPCSYDAPNLDRDVSPLRLRKEVRRALHILRYKLRPTILREKSREALISGTLESVLAKRSFAIHTAPPKQMLHFLKGEHFGRYSNQNSSSALWRESARALSHRHGYPGQVHPADRLGQTVATEPGCLATSHPRQPGCALLGLFLFWNALPARKSLDRSRKLSCNSTSWTSGVLAGTAGQPLAITSLK